MNKKREASKEKGVSVQGEKGEKRVRWRWKVEPVVRVYMAVVWSERRAESGARAAVRRQLQPGTACALAVPRGSNANSNYITYNITHQPILYFYFSFYF